MRNPPSVVPGRGGHARFRLIALAIPLAATPALHAADAGDEQALELDAVEVTTGAPAPGRPLFQAAQIDVLDGDEKARRQGASLGETLDHLPGVDTVGTGNQVGKPVIRGGAHLRDTAAGFEGVLRRDEHVEHGFRARFGFAALLHRRDAGRDVLEVPLFEDASIGLRYGNSTISGNWTHLFSERLFSNFRPWRS